MRNRALAILLMASFIPVAGWTQSHAPFGPEFQVNTVTTQYQWRPGVARTSSGGFVVVWQSPDGGGYGIFARRYDASGAPEGAMEFRVNSYTTGFQGEHTVAATTSDGFAVAWSSDTADGSSFGVLGQRYDGSLLPLGSPLPINDYTTGNQISPAIASDDTGRFVASWGGFGPAGGEEIFGRRYDSVGMAQGGSFQINSYTTNLQRIPSLALDASGNFVVVWMSIGPDGDSWGVVGQRYDASGLTQGGEFLVNVYTTGSQTGISVASQADGRFVVVWQGPGDGSGDGVWARRYDSLGVAQGLPFRVNQYTTLNQTEADVAMDAAGTFVVVWTSDGQDGSNLGAFGRVFDASGAPSSGDFRLNAYTTGNQRFPAVTVDPTGSFVVVWASQAQDGSGWGVFGQRFIPDPIFADGFESASLAAWSSAATDGGDLAVSALAAMDLSSVGMRALVDDTAGLYVQDDTPDDENRYRARFYFDPNGFDPGEAQAHLRTRIFIVFQEAPTRRLAAVVLRRQSGAYSLMARARLDSNAQEDTGFFPISDGPHFVEIDWQRSSGPDALDGSLQLWIDGVSMSTRAGLDNNLSSVDFVRMGALSVKTGSGGTMYWDEFESRRVTYIGP